MKQWARKQTGFTIVELLIVVVVIAILAAITIVSYTGIQNRAADAAVQSDLNALIKKAGIYQADNSRYFTSTGEIAGFVATKTAYATAPTTTYNISSCFVSSGSLFGVVALSKSGKIFYATTASGGVKEYTGGSWFSSSGSACTEAMQTAGTNYNGYLSTDTSSGPWRSWVGGN